MTKLELKNIIKEEYKNRVIREKLEPKDLETIRSLIRYEVAHVLFDLYRKRNVWL
jgi:hypothetical protein